MTSLSDDDARFAREQLAAGCLSLERMVASLPDSQATVAEQVHAIRKLGKSLRGGFALFRLKSTAALEIQAIGRLLSEPRDAVSRFSTWRKLGWNGNPATAAAIAALLEQQTHSAACNPPREAVDWCLSRARRAIDKLEALDPEALAKRVDRGFDQLESKLRKRCSRLEHNGEEDFHDTRKALKALLGAIGILPDGVATVSPGMAELAEILGDENDLATLAEWLKRHGFTKSFVPALWKKVKGRRRRLRKQACRDAAGLL